MKFGKEFASQTVPEWQEAYMNYNHLKTLLKEILIFRHRQSWSSPVNHHPPPPPSKASSLKRKVSLFRAFSGLTSRYGNPSLKKDKEDEVILVSAMHQSDEEQGEDVGRSYQTIFLRSAEDGGEFELVFFRKLDYEFNKVIRFYQEKVEEVMKQAEELNVQMDAFVALRIKVNDPYAASLFVNEANSGSIPLEVIHEEQQEKRVDDNAKEYKIASLEVLNHMKINASTETPQSAMKSIFRVLRSDLHYNKNELKDAQGKLKLAFIEFHEKLRFLKNYAFLNQLAFSKIMKKYDKITTRNASDAYLQMVEDSYLSKSDEVAKLIERVEAAFIKHFCNGNHHKGMNILRPKAKKETHSVTFFVGCFFGCSLALIVAIVSTIQSRDLLDSPNRGQYMNTIFPLYTLFGFIVLHLLMYAGNVYYWTRLRVNYSFIFGFSPGTELGFKQVLLLGSGLSVITLAGILSNLDMDRDPNTQSYKALTELLPLALVIVVLLIIVCPFNIFYRANRFFLLVCLWHCICAPFYAVTLPDFFLADQFTSQVQLLRSLQFYVCYYGWGDFKERNARTCDESKVYETIFVVIAVVPYWIRVLQCLRRLRHDSTQALNALKYFSTIVAVVARTIDSQTTGIGTTMTVKLIALCSSIVATIFSTYWDLVKDWGLLCRNSENPWLRDKLILPNRSIYFIAMVLNVILRLAWMQTVMDVVDTPFLHENALIALIASLEIIRRGLWNFFRLENEHLNNVGKFRAVKSVPLPFSHQDGDKNQ